jgi:two-component system sensor histidine kinase KdpD
MAAAVGGLESGDLHLSEEDRAGLLETIRLELARITRLVTNLLDFSRLQAGAARPHPELWSVDDLVGQALDEIGEPERVTVSVPADLPAVRVDAIQLQRVLVNLLDNALKFSGTGTVELRATGRGSEVLLEVLDRGSGLGGADPASLLEPFARGHAGSASGAGLGLAIARGFAEVNGVQLELEAREGGGTCARLTLAAEPLP